MATGTFQWYRNCPICGPEGALCLVKQTGDGKLGIRCAECFAHWSRPEDVDAEATPGEGISRRVVSPTDEEIEAAGWDELPLKPMQVDDTELDMAGE